MGQIVGKYDFLSRVNLKDLSTIPTPAAGEHILVSSDNSMNAAGQGNFDCYIVGDGKKAATALPLIKIVKVDNEAKVSSDTPISSGYIYNNNKENYLENTPYPDFSSLLEYGNITIKTNGWTYSSSSSRVRLKEGETLRLYAGQQVSVRKYNMYIGWRKADGTYGLSNGWVTSFNVEEDGEYTFLFQRINGTAVTIEEVLDAFIFPKSIIEQHIEQGLSVLNEKIETKAFVTQNLSETLEYGNIVINSAGHHYGDTIRRVRTKESAPIHLVEGQRVHFAVSTLNMYLGWYDNDKVWHYQGWITEFVAPCTSDYYILFAHVNGSFPIYLTEIAVNLLIDAPINNYVQNTIAGFGNQIYYGDRPIQLNIHNKRFNVSVETIYTETYGGSNIKTIAQGMAIYNDKIFVFIDNVAQKQEFGVSVYSLSVSNMGIRSVQHIGDYPSPSKSHQNNAQFTNVFYAQEDTYPLLLLSCGDYPGGDTNCYIVRIQENNNEFVFSIVKTISCTLQEAQYNGSWVADYNQKRLWLYTLTKGTYLVTKNNNMCLFEFELPDLSSSEQVTLTESDVVKFTLLPYGVIQGADVHAGKIFIPVERLREANGVPAYYPNHCIIVVNPNTGSIENVIPSDTLENEGICIYNGRLYITAKDGLPASDDAVMFKIIEYDFA